MRSLRVFPRTSRWPHLAQYVFRDVTHTSEQFAMTNEFPLSVYALGQPTIIARRIYPSHCAIYLMQNILIIQYTRGNTEIGWFTWMDTWHTWSWILGFPSGLIFWLLTSAYLWMTENAFCFFDCTIQPSLSPMRYRVPSVFLCRTCGTDSKTSSDERLMTVSRGQWSGFTGLSPTASHASCQECGRQINHDSWSEFQIYHHLHSFSDHITFAFGVVFIVV